MRRDRTLFLPLLASILGSALLGQTISSATAAELKVERERMRPGGIGPFEIRSRDNKSKMRLGLEIALLSQMDGIDEEPGAPKTIQYELSLERLRERLTVGALSDDLTIDFQLNTTFGNVEILDLYLNYRFTPQIEIRLGQFVIPFTRYRMGAYKVLTFPDWALATSYFGAERQRGIAVHNGIGAQPKLAYALGIFAGENARASHGKGIAKVHGVDLDNGSNLLSPAPGDRIHPEVTAHLSYNHGGIDTSGDTDHEGGPPRFSVGISGAFDLSSDRRRDFFMRMAPEMLFKAYGLSVLGVIYAGFADVGADDFDNRFAMWGLFTQTSYLVRGRVELSARFALVDVDDGYFESEAAFQNNVEAISTMEHELTFGLNVIIIGTSLRWQNDVSWLYREHASGGRDDSRFRSQLTLIF